MRKIKVVRDTFFALMAAGVLAVGAQTLPVEKDEKEKAPNNGTVVEKLAVPTPTVEAKERADKELIQLNRPTLKRVDVPDAVVPDDPQRKDQDYKFVGEERCERLPIAQKQNFNWSGATLQSLMFLGVQHSFRMLEPKTRTELKGPFFRDWKDSVKNLEGWDDGGKFFTNYVAHPLQGSAMARIYLNNDREALRVEFGNDPRYWKTRAKALLWATAWNVQFEIGPISEASIGNVGRTRHADGKSKMTWGDMIVTPIGGIAVAIGEDAIDKYVLHKWIERGDGRKITVGAKILRCFLTPTMAFTNLFRGRTPWFRDHRRN